MLKEVEDGGDYIIPTIRINLMKLVDKIKNDYYIGENDIRISLVYILIMEASNDVRHKRVLTDEEKQKRRDYNRAYMAKRRLDPEFLAKQQEYCRKSHQRPEAKEKEKERNNRRKDYFSLYHLEKKKLVERVKELEKQLKM